MAEPDYLEEWSEEPVEQPAEDAQADAQEQEARGGGRAQERIRQLIAERDAERARAALAEERAQKMADLEAKVRELAEQRRAAEEKPPEPAPIPEFVEDPVGHVDAKVGRLQSELARLEKMAADGSAKAQAEATQAREQLALEQFKARVRDSESTFVARHPDYYQALEHSRQARRQEMEYLGLDKAEIDEAIKREEVNAAMAALARGKDVAEFVYRRAQATGFRGSASTAAASTDPKLQAEIDLYERRRMAQSIGGGGADEGGELEPAGDAWSAVENAFKELYGEPLR